MIERGILDLKGHFQKEKAMSPEEREIRGLLRPFARFQSLDQHEELVKALLKEVQLKQAVEQLLLAKHVGCQNLDDLERLVFDTDNSAKIVKLAKALKQSLEAGEFEEDENPRPNRGKDKKSRQRKNQDFAEGAKNYNLHYNEQKLCHKLGIKMPEYMIIKEMILRESVKNSIVTRDEIKKNVQLSDKVFNSIFDFMVHNELFVER